MIAVLVNSLAGGGAERIGLTLLKEMQSRGLKVLLICIEREQIYVLPENTEIYYLTQFEKLKNPLLKVFWVFICAYKLSKLIKRKKIDFIQSHITRSNFINTGAKFFGAKHIAQIVTHLPIDFSTDHWLIRPFKKAYYTWFHLKADEAVSISKIMWHGLENSMHLSKNGVNHVIIHNPHDLQRIETLAKETPNGFEFKSDAQYIVSAGRLVAHKRVADILMALKLVIKQQPKVILLVLGEGEEKENLKKLAQTLGLESNVHFLGHQSNPFSFIARSDLFLLASEREGLPNIIIESMICGTPVLSSDCLSGPREILSPDSDYKVQLTNSIEFARFGVLFPVGSVDLMAEAIEGLLKDSSTREGYKKSGFTHIRDFDKSYIADQYIKRYYPKLIKKTEN